jgi:hypothetical protein
MHISQEEEVRSIAGANNAASQSLHECPHVQC